MRQVVIVLFIVVALVIGVGTLFIYPMLTSNSSPPPDCAGQGINGTIIKITGNCMLPYSLQTNGPCVRQTVSRKILLGAPFDFSTERWPFFTIPPPVILAETTSSKEGSYCIHTLPGNYSLVVLDNNGFYCAKAKLNAVSKDPRQYLGTCAVEINAGVTNIETRMDVSLK